MIADDIEVLIKLLPTFGYFCCVIVTTQLGGKAKRNIEILESKDSGARGLA